MDRCTKCGELLGKGEGWPGAGGDICQMCWEAYCADEWWKMVVQLPSKGVAMELNAAREIDALKARVAELEARVLPDEIVRLLESACAADDGAEELLIFPEERKFLDAALDWWRKSKGA